MSKRIIAFIFCFVILAGLVPVTNAKAVSETNYYRNVVLERYSESFIGNDYYSGLVDGDAYYYKQWSNNVENNNGALKFGCWLSNLLMDKNHNKEAYIDYLCNLLAMMENGFSDSVSAQASYTAKLSAMDYASGIADIAFSDLLAGRYATLKDLATNTLGGVDILDEVITDMEQLGAVSAMITVYEEKITVLDTIIKNTDDPKLKDTANDVIKACDVELLYLLDNYSDNIAGYLVGVECDVLDTDWFTAVVSVICNKDVKENFAQWLNAHCTGILNKIGETFVKCSSYFLLGFTIGVNIMKLVYSEKAEYYREMVVMDSISDALIPELKSLKKLCDSTANEDLRYSYICDYVTIAKMLTYTHLRGEYCNVESRSGDKANGAKPYYSRLVGKFHEYEKTISWISTWEGMQVVSDEFTLHDGFIKKVNRKTSVPVGYVGIYSYEDWAHVVANQPTGWGNDLNEYNTANYILMSDIVLPDDYEPLYVYGGIFDGNGYTIHNVQSTFIQALCDAKVCNLALSVAHVKDYEDEECMVGCLANYVHYLSEGKSVIDNCYTTGIVNIKIRSGEVGGLMAHGSDAVITNCYNAVDISVNSRQGVAIGGICGQSGEISNCFNTGNIFGYATTATTASPWGIDVLVGGISGSTSQISHCYNTGEVLASAAYICTVSAGGITGLGLYDCDVRFCYNTGSVKSYADYPSDNLDDILEDEETNVSANFAAFYAGGIVGCTNCWITSSSLDSHWIENCWNDGTVYGRHYSGGIVGNSLNLLITNCCNTAEVSGDLYAGGVSGKMGGESRISYSYNIGAVSSGVYIGALAGSIEKPAESMINCYYQAGGLTATALGAIYSGAKALTSEEMTSRDTYEGFDFAKVWEFKDNGLIRTPLLRFWKNTEI